jgi:TfoX/Sxy family transcriptional regulator of competence genes
MAYSHTLADRVRLSLRQTGQIPSHQVTEKKMFGGLAFLLRGNMLVGVWQSALIARLGPDSAAQPLRQPHVGPFPATGRPMKGWVMIAPDGLESDRELSEWLERAIAFVDTLPGK